MLLFKKRKIPCYNARLVGSVAQLVEQRIENPRVGGSIPPRATKKNTEGINAIEACALWRFSLSVRIQKNKCERVFRVNRMAHS